MGRWNLFQKEKGFTNFHFQFCSLSEQKFTLMFNDVVVESLFIIKIRTRILQSMVCKGAQRSEDRKHTSNHAKSHEFLDSFTFLSKGLKIQCEIDQQDTNSKERTVCKMFPY